LIIFSGGGGGGGGIYNKFHWSMPQWMNEWILLRGHPKFFFCIFELWTDDVPLG
jgi:hypothetical protein